MNAVGVRIALTESLKAAGVDRPDAAVMRMTECQLYRVIRELMHRLDEKSSKLALKRYGIKAVAGMMRELIELRGCDDAGPLPPTG